MDQQSRSRQLTIWLTASGVVVVAALIIAAVLIWAPSDAPEAADRGNGGGSSAEAEHSRDAAPEPEKPTEPEDADDELDYGPNDPEIDGTGPVAPRLQALGDRYKAMNDDGSLWELMPETKENTGAYLAFQVILSDMRSATRFGVGAATETQYAKHAKHLETRFLAQQPLGTGVEYVLQDGRTFSYDGDTGEVGLE
ncbi:hypothetical protein [Leucobacter sp. GX0328]